MKVTVSSASTAAQALAVIQFDTEPQAGHFLHLTVDEYSDSDPYGGFEFFATGAGGIEMESSSTGPIRIRATGATNELQLEARNDLRLTTLGGGGDIIMSSDSDLQATSDGQMTLYATGGALILQTDITTGDVGAVGLQLQATNGNVRITSGKNMVVENFAGNMTFSCEGGSIGYLSDGYFDVRVGTDAGSPSKYFRIADSSGNPWLVVDIGAGTYRIKSGKSWAATL